MSAFDPKRTDQVFRCGTELVIMREHSRTAPGGIPRLRPEAIALLSYGFRPFFLGAAIWACVAMVLWVGLLSGWWTFATGYALAGSWRSVFSYSSMGRCS